MVRPLQESDWCDLIGAPWALGGRDPATGLDCWQLVRTVCERRGIHVPDIPEPGHYQDRQAIAAPDLSGWRQIEAGEREPGDVAAYSLSGRVIDHVGVYVGGGLIVHSRANSGAVALSERADRAKLRSWWRPGPAECPHLPTGHDRQQAEDVIGDTSSGVVVVRIYRSLLDTSDFATHVCEWTGGFVGEYLPLDLSVAEVGCSIHGQVLTRVQIDTHRPRQGDVISVLLVPGGPAIVAAIGGFATVAAAEAAIGAVGFAILSFAVTSAISIGLSFLAGILFAAPQAPVDRSTVDASPTFSQQGIRNTIAAGGTIPIVFGTHRVGGQIIGSYNSIGGLTVTPYLGTVTPTNPGGPFDLVQNTNAASATGGKTTLNLLIALSEGEIEAINGITADVDGQAASTLARGTLYIDGNDAVDYSGVTFSTRLGTTNQTIIPGFSDSITAVGVERPLKYQQPWTHTTTTDCTAFAIQLFEPNGHYRIAASDGSTRQKTATYLFQYRPVGATTWTQSMTITRGYINRAPHSWEIKIQGIPRGKWEMSLERTTHDDESSLWQSGGSNNPQEVSLSTVNAVNEIIEGGVSHGGIALLAVHAVATDQLSGVPTVTSLVKGKKLWVWDGLSETDPRFTFRWTDNPAEVIGGILNNPAWGLGRYVGVDRVRWADLKTVADYCDESISDGRGGLMSRWRFDYVYDRAEKSGDLLDKVLTACRSSMVVVAGKIGFRVDKTRTPVHLFSEGNVTETKISYVDVNRQPSRINVSFANAELDYDLDTISVEDQTVEDENFIEETVTVLGVTKPARAMRFGQHRLNISRTPLRTLTFTAPASAVTLSPGDAFWFSHHELSTVQAGGILLSANSVTVSLDRDVVIDNSLTYKIRICWWKASTDTKEIQEFTLATPTSGTIAAGTSISWATPLGGPNVPSAGAVYAFGISSEYVTPFIAISAPMSEAIERSVSAIEYDSTVYDDDPGTVPSATDALFERKHFAGRLSNVSAKEQARTMQDGTVRSLVAVEWVPGYAFERADVWYRWPSIDDVVSWTLLGRFTGRAEIEPHSTTGDLAISVVPVSPLGHAEGPESGKVIHIIVHGKTDLPETVTGLTADDVEGGVLLSWTPVSDRDLSQYEVRHGTTWPMARTLACVAAPACSVRLPRQIPDAYALDSVYMVKALNTSGQESETAAEITFAPTSTDTETVAQTEETSWSGTDSNMTLSSGTMVSDSAATTCGYTTAAIDTGAIARQYVTAAVEAHMIDRGTVYVSDAVWTVGSSGSSTRMVTPGVISDYPTKLRDHARLTVTGAGSMVSGALSQHMVSGPSPRSEFTIETLVRVADTSGGLSSADWEPLTDAVRSFRWYQVRVNATVPHADYQVIFTGLRTAAYLPSVNRYVTEEATRGWLGAGGYNSPQFFNQSATFISGWGYGRSCPDAANTTIAFKHIPVPKWAKADGSNYFYVDLTWTINASPGSDLAWVARASVAAHDIGDADPGSGLTNTDLIIPVTTAHVSNVKYRTTVTINDPDIYTGAEEHITFALYRRGTDGSDTFTGTVSVIGIEIRSGVKNA